MNRLRSYGSGGFAIANFGFDFQTFFPLPFSLPNIQSIPHFKTGQNSPISTLEIDSLYPDNSILYTLLISGIIYSSFDLFQDLEENLNSYLKSCQSSHFSLIPFAISASPHSSTHNEQLDLDDKEEPFNRAILEKESKPNLEAIYLNGIRFLDGDDIAEPNHNIAFKLFREAAKLGHIKSMVSLAFCYQMGIGIHPNGALSLKWYKKAAKLGNPEAQIALGKIYQNGQCDQLKNLKLAEKYFSLAVSNGDAEAKIYLQNLWNE